MKRNRKLGIVAVLFQDSVGLEAAPSMDELLDVKSLMRQAVRPRQSAVSVLGDTTGVAAKAQTLANELLRNGSCL